MLCSAITHAFISDGEAVGVDPFQETTLADEELVTVIGDDGDELAPCAKLSGDGGGAAGAADPLADDELWAATAIIGGSM